MAIMNDLAKTKVNLIKVTMGHKLGKKITSDILMPILDQLEKDVPNVLAENAEWVRERIVEYIQNSTPSGKNYKIYEYSTGEKNVIEHTASTPGQPPAILTGTLVSSIDYEVFDDGYFTVGVLKDWGEFSDAGTELVMKHKTVPVGTYAKWLAGGVLSSNLEARPFTAEVMVDIRDELRERIRNAMKQSLRRATRRISVRRAVIFKVYFK